MQQKLQRCYRKLFDTYGNGIRIPILVHPMLYIGSFCKGIRLKLSLTSPILLFQRHLLVNNWSIKYYSFVNMMTVQLPPLRSDLLSLIEQILVFINSRHHCWLFTCSHNVPTYRNWHIVWIPFLLCDYCHVQIFFRFKLRTYNSRMGHLYNSFFCK